MARACHFSRVFTVDPRRMCSASRHGPTRGEHSSRHSQGVALAHDAAGEDAMKTLQLVCSAAAAVAVTAGAACNRSDTNDRAQQAANQVREVAARAGDELAD